ncbi:hypothetical protein DVH05_008906 [Phytophthora capsici]|nr:hypothetical protein DVH05_008906 [Phytophthora capsici]
MEHAKNRERKHEVISRKLDLEERKWRAEQRESELQRRLEYEQRDRELANRAVSQRHELFLALIQQGKTSSEIEMILKLYGTS